MTIIADKTTSAPVTRSRTRRRGIVLLTGLLLLVGGCGREARSHPLSTEIERIDAETRSLADQVRMIEKDLSTLEQAGRKQLPDAFQALANDVTLFEKSVEDLDRRTADYRERRDVYLEDWRRRMAEIESGDVTKIARDRLHALANCFDRLARQADRTQDAVSDHAGHLADLVTALDVDLTRASVEAYDDVIDDLHRRGDRALDELEELQRKTASIVEELDGGKTGEGGGSTKD